MISTPTNLGTATSSSGAATSLSITTGATVPAGATILLATYLTLVSSSGSAGVTSISDSAGNTYTAVDSGAAVKNTAVGGPMVCYIANNVNQLNSGSSITINFASGQQSILMAASYVTGLTASPVDKINNSTVSTTGSGATVSTGTLSQPSEIVIGMMAALDQTSLSFTQASGFTTMTGPANVSNSNLSGFQWGYQIVSSTSSVSYTPSASLSGTFVWGEDVFSLKGQQFAAFNMPMLGM